MSDMFDLAMPWWEFVLRAVIVYVAVLVMVRLSGKRTMGQLTPFDMLLIVLLGNAVQNALLGKDNSVGGGLLLAGTLVTLNWCVGLIGSRSPAAQRILEGQPVILARDGQVFREVLRRELVSPADFEKALRENNCRELSQVRMALLEIDGRITILTGDGAAGAGAGNGGGASR